MHAMVLVEPQHPLQYESVPIPKPTKDQVLIKVNACGVCRTDLHIYEGELSSPTLPLILGHQIVGTIAKLGGKEAHFKVGDRVGVTWLGETCGRCPYCREGLENLCDKGLFTGYQLNGGFAEYCVANSNFIFPLPKNYPDLEVAPLLCGGVIGYRAFRFAENARKLGFYGFGSSAHILTQLAVRLGREVYAFTKGKDKAAQSLAVDLGAKWVGSSEELPPEQLDAAIIFAPVGSLVPEALKAVKKGGFVICAGIHMSDIPSFPYSLLYGERKIVSVTNLTRQDAEEFLRLANDFHIKTKVTTYPLTKANEALQDLKKGRFTGSAVIALVK